MIKIRYYDISFLHRVMEMITEEWNRSKKSIKYFFDDENDENDVNDENVTRMLREWLRDKRDGKLVGLIG